MTPKSDMYTALIIDEDHGHAQRIAGAVRSRHLAVGVASSPEDALRLFRSQMRGPHLVILNVSDPSQPWLSILRELRTAIEISRQELCLFLCVSTRRTDALFELQIEKLGGRFVYER